MNHLLTPKLDLVFKMLFTKDDELLTDLLNAVLNLSTEKRICSVEVLNPTILPETVKQKLIILDIHATDASGRQYDIEMQVRKHSFYPRRTLYYVSKLYADQLNAGDEYRALKPVIGIHFLDYEQFPDYDDFHFCFQFREQRHPELTLTDDITLHLFELPVFDKRMGETKKMALLEEWLWFFCHAHEEKEKKMRTHYANPKIQKAFDMLEALSADTDVRILAEEREKALKDEASALGSARREGEQIGFEKGLEDGQRQNAIQTAKKLLKMGVLSTDQIADATGLELDEIEKLETVRSP